MSFRCDCTYRQHLRVLSSSRKRDRSPLRIPFDAADLVPCGGVLAISACQLGTAREADLISFEGLSSGDAGIVTNRSVSVCRNATMSLSSWLVRPRLPIKPVTLAVVSGSGQQLTFSPGDP